MEDLYIRAAEAYAQAIQVNEKFKEDELREIFTTIKNAVDLGKFNIFVYHRLYEDNKKYLRSYGYCVNETPSMCCISSQTTVNDYITEISWR